MDKHKQYKAIWLYNLLYIIECFSKLNSILILQSSDNNEPPEPMIFNDNYSESDGSNNLMLDEYQENQ